MSRSLIFNCTHGTDDPERAILPFIAANVAVTAGLDVTVVCTVEAVWLGTRGGAEGVVKEGFPALPALIDEFCQNGGKIWLCGACTKPRGITPDDTAPGASIVGAATIVEAIAKGATPIAFA
jgi:predicted peroxiredoxin